MPAPPVPAELPALRDLGVEAARRAGNLLLEGLERERAWVETKSTATDMVSEMDRSSEELIVRCLLAARPTDGIVGEEGTERTGTSGVRWVVDPLDGTTNYLYGHPGWAVSVAAEAADGVLIGVVWDPMHRDLFTAVRSRGARRNGRPIACTNKADLATALVATGFGYAADRRRAQGRLVAEVLPRIRDIRRMGSAAVDLCSVACGRVDAYFEHGLGWWDFAAGSLIAAEAGASVSALDGSALPTAGVIAAAPGIATPLRDLLASIGISDVP